MHIKVNELVEMRNDLLQIKENIKENTRKLETMDEIKAYAMNIVESVNYITNYILQSGIDTGSFEFPINLEIIVPIAQLQKATSFVQVVGETNSHRSMIPYNTIGNESYQEDSHKSKRCNHSKDVANTTQLQRTPNDSPKGSHRDIPDMGESQDNRESPINRQRRAANKVPNTLQGSLLNYYKIHRMLFAY